MRKQFLYIHLCGLFIFNCTVIKCNMDAKRLYDDLFSNYNQLVRPVLNDSESVKVQIKLKLSQLIEVNLKDQIMTTSMWIEHWWHDSNLRWNPTDYGGIEYIHLVLYNNAAADFEVTLTTKAKLNYKGNIYYSPPAIYKSSCEINVEMFPFDSQNCRMKFGSWTHDGFAIDLNHRDQVPGKAEVESGIDLSDFQVSVEWDIERVPAIKNTKSYLCCESPFLDLTFNISMRRKTLFYTVNLILPCTGISFLTVLVFYLPSDSGEKISLSVSILVALTVFFLLLAETIPPTSLVVPFLGKYLLFTMLLVGLSICVTVIVLNIHFKSTRSVQMSKWTKKIFLEILPKFLLMKRPEYKYVNNKYFNQTNYSNNSTDHNLDKLSKNKLPFKNDKEQINKINKLKRSSSNNEKTFDQKLNTQTKNVKKNENLIKNHLTLDKKSPFRSKNRIVPLNSSLNNSIYSIDENFDYQSNLNKNIDKKRSFSIQSLSDDENLKDLDNEYINDCNNNNFFANKPLKHSMGLNEESDIELDNLNDLENLNDEQSINHYQSNKSINQPNILINDCLLCRKNSPIQKHYSDTFVDCKYRNLLSKYRNKLTKSIDQNLLNQTILNQSLIDNKIRNIDQNDNLITTNKQKQKIDNDKKIFLDALYRIETNPHIMRAMKNVYFLAEHATKLQQEEEIKEEWHYMAMVLDRLFLWIFLIFVLLGSLSIITIEQNATGNNNTNNILGQSNRSNSLNST